MLSRSTTQRASRPAPIFFGAAILLFFLSLSASPARAQAPGPTTGSYWICRVIPGGGASYYSDIFTAPVNAYSDMAKGFSQFLAARYNQKNGVPTCISYVSDQQALTYMKQFAAGGKSVLTGWKYGEAATPTAPTASPAPTLPASPASASAPVAAAKTPSPANAAPRAAGEVSALCEMTTANHTYASAIFSGDYKNKAQWEIAFSNYIYTNFDKSQGNGGCMTYPSAAPNERTLQSWKSQPNSRLFETNWVYKGPEPGPAGNNPNRPPNPGHGK